MHRIITLVLVSGLFVSAAACNKKSDPAPASTPADDAAAKAAAEPPKPVPAELPDVLARVLTAGVARAIIGR